MFLQYAPILPILFQRSRVYAPFTAALAVGARARVPDRLVGHVDGWLSWVGERCFVGRGSEAVYRVNGSRSVEQSGGVCVPVVDVVAGRGRLGECGLQSHSRYSLALVEFRAFLGGSARPVVAR